jgi:hypothetical protein
LGTAATVRKTEGFEVRRVVEAGVRGALARTVVDPALFLFLLTTLLLLLLLLLLLEVVVVVVVLVLA